MFCKILWDYNSPSSNSLLGGLFLFFFLTLTLNKQNMKSTNQPIIKSVNTLKMSESGKLTLNGSQISPSELLIIVNLMANVCEDKAIGTDKVEFLNAWIDNHQNPCK